MTPDPTFPTHGDPPTSPTPSQPCAAAQPPLAPSRTPEAPAIAPPFDAGDLEYLSWFRLIQANGA